MIGFVDDSSSQVNNFTHINQENIEQIMKDMEKYFQQWSDMLHFTGGALNFSKCSYHITHYAFTETGRPYLTTPGTVAQINITENNIQQTITQFSHTIEAKTLGVMKCPSGNTSLWFKKLYKISQNYSQIILLSACENSEAFTFLYSMV